MRKYEQASCKEMNAKNLEKLAKAINEKCPEWMAGYLSGNDEHVSILGKESPQWRVWFTPARCDLTNAAFIVWALERITEIKGASYVSGEPLDFAAGDFHPSEGHYGCLAFAKTRAEALATALLKALAVEEPVREES